MGFKVCIERCDACLFSKDAIVSDARRRQLLSICALEDRHFVCHKHGTGSEDELHGEDVCCRGWLPITDICKRSAYWPAGIYVDGGVLLGYGAPSLSGPPAGLWDALDQVTDKPETDETIFVYKLIPGTWGQVFVRPGVRFENGDYTFVAVDYPEELREYENWEIFVAEREGLTLEELRRIKAEDGR